MKLVHWPLMGELLHLVQQGGTGRGRSPPRPLLAVPNVTAHPSAPVFRIINEKERERRESSREGGVWGEGIPFPSGRGVWGKGPCLSPEICLIFLSGNGAFWCILGTCFNVSIRRVKQSRKAVFVCKLPIGQLSHMADVSSMISYT